MSRKKRDMACIQGSLDVEKFWRSHDNALVARALRAELDNPGCWKMERSFGQSWLALAGAVPIPMA